jgi:uroporphyrinogen-III decarboxylase
MFAFYDHPDLMKEMSEDLLAFNLRVYERFCEICVPDFMTVAEDMSYNHGPMLSQEQFDEFMAPYYKRIVPTMRERGTVVFVDTDGDITIPAEWFEGVGVQGLLPLERMAGVDVSQLRTAHPRLRLLGAFDKTVMHLGEDRIRQEFERLLPVMRQGGFIPSVDHQTPPGVSLDQYRVYMSLLREYCDRAAK